MGKELQEYNAQQYLLEKKQGIRRSNGAMKLMRLTGRHLGIIARHLDGQTGEQISKETGVSYSTVTRVLNDPLAKKIIEEVLTLRNSEIKALGGQAVEAVRDVLTGDHKPATKLAAVDRYAKLRTVMVDEEADKQTAEDVIAGMFEGSTFHDKVQINVGKDK